MTERGRGRDNPNGQRRNSGPPPKGRGGRPNERNRGRDGGRGRGGGRNEGDRDDRRGKSQEKPEQSFGKNARGSAWGGVARRGAHNASVAGRGWGDDPEGDPPADRDTDRWERRDRRPRSAPRKRAAEPQLDLPEIEEVMLRGLPIEQQERLRRRLRDAGVAFLADRFGDAERLLIPLAKRYPHIPEILELHGVTQYRLGHWKRAIGPLERFAELTGDVSQLPVLADCYRATGQHVEVRRLWDELRQAGPEAATMVEGRIVMAGSLADQDDLTGAIRLLEQGPVRAKKARDHNIRLWYALADLYERAGENQRARRGFERIEQAEPGYVDVPERLAGLR